MKKSINVKMLQLICYRLYDKSYGEGANPKTLIVWLNSDDTLSYISIFGWQNSGMGNSISNFQLKEPLPLSVKDFNSTEELDKKITEILGTGVGSKDISSKKILNELKVIKVNKKELVDNLHNVSEWIVEMVGSNGMEEEHIKLMLDKIDETIEYLNN